MEINHRSVAFVFPFMSLNEKKSESIYFVLFGSRVFSVRWQGLRIMKYVVDSNRQIIDLFERHTYKYVRKSWACGFSFSPFWHLSADLSYIKKNVISQLEFWPILSFPLSPSQSPHTESEYALALCPSQTEWILGCHNYSEMALSHFLSYV